MTTWDYETRWHDPAFLKLWQRWQDARNRWHRTFPPAIDGKFRFNVYPTNDLATEIALVTGNPPSKLRDDMEAALREFIEARLAYFAYLDKLEKPKSDESER